MILGPFAAFLIMSMYVGIPLILIIQEERKEKRDVHTKLDNHHSDKFWNTDNPLSRFEKSIRKK